LRAIAAGFRAAAAGLCAIAAGRRAVRPAAFTTGLPATARFRAGATAFFVATFRTVLERAGLRTTAARRVAVRAALARLTGFATILTFVVALTFALIFALALPAALAGPFPARTALRAFTAGRRVGLLREVEAMGTTLGMVESSGTGQLQATRTRPDPLPGDRVDTEK
jgi:hypothetical protein